MINTGEIFVQLSRLEKELTNLKRMIRKHIVEDVDSPPKCFGSFDEDNETCLNCIEQDSCEVKMIKAKWAGITTATAVPCEISADELMAAMEDALNR